MTKPASPRRKLVIPITLQLLAMVAIGVLVFPSAADWFAAWRHGVDTSGYVHAVEQTSDEELQARRRAAQEYNDNLPAGVLRDPYATAGPTVTDIRETAAYRSYEDALAVLDDGPIGFLTYPALGIGMPIRPGTDDDTISSGVGHLYGSSLPVGGPSTHSVLTSHSGMLHDKLFSDLPQAEVGDVFQVATLGETKYYEVQSIETVLPRETENLVIAPGEDWVSLFTCVPLGVNTHRLMVHAVRVEGPVSEGGAVVAGGGPAGFPWWLVVFLGGSAVVAYLAFAPSSLARRRGQRPPKGRRG